MTDATPNVGFPRIATELALINPGMVAVVIHSSNR